MNLFVQENTGNIEQSHIEQLTDSGFFSRKHKTYEGYSVLGE